MKRPSLETVSLFLNVLLLFTLLVRKGQRWLVDKFQVEMEAPSWATFAGNMQASADYGNGVRRFYRPTLELLESSPILVSRTMMSILPSIVTTRL